MRLMNLSPYIPRIMQIAAIAEITEASLPSSFLTGLLSGLENMILKNLMNDIIVPALIILRRMDMVFPVPAWIMRCFEYPPLINGAPVMLNTAIIKDMLRSLECRHSPLISEIFLVPYISVSMPAMRKSRDLNMPWVRK